MPLKIYDVQQGSAEWLLARLGKITASNFDKVITKTGKPSAQVEDLINTAVAEAIIGEPIETYQSDAMLRGQILEPEALEFFNFVHGTNFKPVGFIDSGLNYGCSPDAIDWTNAEGLELKCPLAHTHVKYLSSNALPEIYKLQVQGGMLVTGFDTWRFASYHPNLPFFSVTVPRDEKIITSLRDGLLKASEEIEKRKIKIQQLME